MKTFFLLACFMGVVTAFKDHCGPDPLTVPASPGSFQQNLQMKYLAINECCRIHDEAYSTLILWDRLNPLKKWKFDIEFYECLANVGTPQAWVNCAIVIASLPLG